VKRGQALILVLAVAALVSVSASTDAANQQRLAAEVRGLRDELGTLASGMSEAYEAQEAAAGDGDASEQQP
jgi:hypothetical protein